MTAAWSTGGSSTTSGFRTRTRARVTAGNRSMMPVRHRAGEPFEEQALLPAEHIPHQRGQSPVVDGVLDAVALGRLALHVDPEIDEEALAEAPLLLQVPVVAEHHQPL